MAEAYFKHVKRGRFEDEDGTDRDAGANYLLQRFSETLWIHSKYLKSRVNVCMFAINSETARCTAENFCVQTNVVAV